MAFRLLATRKQTARQPGPQRPPGQPGGQDQAQDQFVAVEDGNQFPHQQDLGDGRGETEGQQRTLHLSDPVTVQPHPSPSGFAAAAAGLGPKGLRPEGGGGGSLNSYPAP